MTLFPPDPRKARESRLQDSLTRFLEQVAEPASARPSEVADGSFLLCRFVEGIGRVLMDGSLWAVWESKRHVFGAYLGAVGDDAVTVPAAEARALIDHAQGRTIDIKREAAVSITWLSQNDGAEIVRVAAEGPRSVTLWLLRPPSDVTSANWQWLKAYLPGLRSMFVTLRALFQTRAAAEATIRRSRYEAGIKSLARERTREFTKFISDASEQVDELAAEDEIDCLDLLEDLAVAVLQELMGTGWTVRQVGRYERPSSPGSSPGGGRASIPGDGRPYESGILAHVLDQLEALLASQPLATGNKGYDEERTVRRRRLGEVCRSFRALLDQPDVREPPPIQVGNEAMALLPLWTRVHEVCRALCRPRPPTRDDYDRATQFWNEAVEQTLLPLARHLELHPALPNKSDAPPESRRRGRPSARNWLALWFALTILSRLRAMHVAEKEATERGDGAPSSSVAFGDPESNLLHADLAYVLREGVRFACFGNRIDFFYQPSTYAAALRRLVEFHAHRIVELPRDYNVVKLLEEIGDQDGLNRYISAEHLQHVLEIYIAGHFLLSVQIDVSAAAPGAGPHPASELHGLSVAAALSGSTAGRVSKDKVRRLEQAYTLASLFHDVGHMLFPRDSVPHDSLDWDDEQIAENRRTLEKSVNTAASLVSQKCFAELNHLYCTEEELTRWREPLGGQGEPNHGLLGAWYLHRVGTSVLARAGDVDGFREAQSDILKMAVRAVLVHGASTGQVRTDRDPVAALLIALNEVFEWDPTRHLATAPSQIGRSFHVMAADVAPREPRDAWIGIPSLAVKVTARSDNTGTPALVSSLIVDAGMKSWPEIHVGLQAPQRLDVPVLRIWLVKAQSLGRLVPTRHGLCPVIVMRSNVDTNLLTRNLTNKSLLERVAERRSLSSIRPAIRGWLAMRDRFEDRDLKDRHEEVVRLGPLEQRFLFDDLMKWLREIEFEASEVVRTIDADPDEPASSKRFLR